MRFVKYRFVLRITIYKYIVKFLKAVKIRQHLRLRARECSVHGHKRAFVFWTKHVFRPLGLFNTRTGA